MANLRKSISLLLVLKHLFKKCFQAVCAKKLGGKIALKSCILSFFLLLLIVNFYPHLFDVSCVLSKQLEEGEGK